MKRAALVLIVLAVGLGLGGCNRSKPSVASVVVEGMKFDEAVQVLKEHDLVETETSWEMLLSPRTKVHTFFLSESDTLLLSENTIDGRVHGISVYKNCDQPKDRRILEDTASFDAKTRKYEVMTPEQVWDKFLEDARNYDPPVFNQSGTAFLQRLADAIGFRAAISGGFKEDEAYRWLCELSGYGPTACEVRVTVRVCDSDRSAWVWLNCDEDRWKSNFPAFVLTMDNVEFRHVTSDDLKQLSLLEKDGDDE